MTRTATVLIAALALMTAACTPASEQDARIDELEATITSGRLIAAESTIQALQATPTTAPPQAMATPSTPTTQPLQATPTAASDLQQVRLVRALDGDSGIAADANGEFEFRLYGIDAPERDDVSRVALEQLIAGFGNDLYAEERDIDMYGRRVVVLHNKDGSRSVNVEMVRQGYASAYLDYGELDGVVAAEAEARASGIGIWAPQVPTVDEYLRDVVAPALSASAMSHELQQATARRMRDLLAQALVSGTSYEQYLSGNPERWNSSEWASALRNLRPNWNRQSDRAQQIGDSLHAILTAMARADNPYLGRYADNNATRQIAADELAHPAGYTTAGAAERLLGMQQSS